ncbi:MAG: carotenoid oxygenase family protein [Pseudomonadaceae bacterium]|nr:carotenoid oxygenase family protein [Pseudomonadaceae bacterium]
MAETTAATATNFFLDGNFAPVDEERDATDMTVQGSIPSDLSGHFLRVGPNPVHIFSEEAYHTFDGDGMIHAIEFHAGTARYRNRFVQNEGFKLEQAHGDWLYKGMNSMLDPTPSRVPEGAPASKNLANTAFAVHNNTLYALHEPSQPTVIRLPGLETEGPTDFDGKLQHPFTAHPKVDQATGEMMTFGYSFQAPYVTYSVIDAGGKLVHSTPITIAKPVFMHDFAVTGKYSLFLDFPITLDIERAIAGGPALDFEPEHGSRIGVMPRFGTDADVRWFDVETGSVVHTANAWDDGDEVVLQASRSKTSDIAGAGLAAENLDDTQGHLYEWRINLKTGTVRERPLSSVRCDFTRVNDTLACHQTRYTYAAVFNPQRPFSFDGVMKFDDDTQSTTIFEYGEQRFGGEAVFAPRINAQEEDDGYLIGFVHDEASNQSECLIIDAQDLASGPVASIIMPFRVPYGFHAGWVAST